MPIHARAPLRLGLAGGGTDVSPYCDRFGGCVLNTTIDKYAYAWLEPSSDGRVAFVATDLETHWMGDARPELDIRGALGLHCAVYNRVVRDFNRGEPISLKLITCSDVPASSGLGSSSALVVAIVKAFEKLLKLSLSDDETARLAYEIERIDMQLSGGKQDQYASAFGGFNFMEFYGDDRVVVNPLRIQSQLRSELEASILLYFTGFSRESAPIIDEQRRNVQCENRVALEAMHEVKREAILMRQALFRGDMDQFAASLQLSWAAKKRTARLITNETIDLAISKAIVAGAKAAKISGAGGGGFMMLLVNPCHRREVIGALGKYGGRVMSCQFTEHGGQSWDMPNT